MKKVASIFAVAIFVVSMVSCTNDNASNDELYDSLEVMANDENDNGGHSGGSGGN